MTRLEESTTQAAGFAWFGLVLFAMLLLAVFLWSFLDGPMHMLLDLASATSDSSRGDEAVRRTRLLWELWPFWGAALTGLLIAYRRATTETRRGF